MLRTAKIGWVSHILPDNRAQGVRVQRLDILWVGAHIANMRKCEIDDLTGVRGVSHHFLITRHRGIKTDFANFLSLGTKAPTPDDFPGRQNQYPRRSRRRARRIGVGHDGVAPDKQITAMSLRHRA
jgi:hypothetical protein